MAPFGFSFILYCMAYILYFISFYDMEHVDIIKLPPWHRLFYIQQRLTGENR